MKGIPEGLRSRARRWGELWGLPDSVTVEFSPRFRSSLGLCRPVEGRVRLAAHLANGRPELLEEEVITRMLDRSSSRVRRCWSTGTLSR